jgi:hypothetical protein
MMTRGTIYPILSTTLFLGILQRYHHSTVTIIARAFLAVANQTANFDLALNLAPYTQIRYIPIYFKLAHGQAL